MVNGGQLCIVYLMLVTENYSADAVSLHKIAFAESTSKIPRYPVLGNQLVPYQGTELVEYLVPRAQSIIRRTMIDRQHNVQGRGVFYIIGHFTETLQLMQ